MKKLSRYSTMFGWSRRWEARAHPIPHPPSMSKRLSI